MLYVYVCVCACLREHTEPLQCCNSKLLEMTKGHKMTTRTTILIYFYCYTSIEVIQHIGGKQLACNTTTTTTMQHFIYIYLNM